MTLSYLVSTAGHSQHQNELYPHNMRTLLELIESGAQEFGDEKVVGFTSVVKTQWRCDRYSFPELVSLSARLVPFLADLGVQAVPTGSPIVALLCPTGLDFLVAWIALMQMGYGVVFIAPQCSASAIASLYQSTASAHLVYHPKYAQLAISAKQDDPAMSMIELASPQSLAATTSALPSTAVDPNSVSHVFHTSGTSGNPKPITHTHAQSVAVLPRRALPSFIQPGSDLPPPEPAAFTTTPLFHGGVSDLLRAWMARSMIYFYPTSDIPITAQHVIDAVAVCQVPPPPPASTVLESEELEERTRRFRVNAFLSVPYILTILSENATGPAMEMLKSMEFVSTGGAPLDQKVGDGLVEKGVHLVSRLGSSECGFLLSSHRDYANEKDWEWLRNDSPFADALAFEKVEGDTEKYEMVVSAKWSSKTKSNREDVSYATGDLYQPHPSKRDVWKYVGRGDDVIVLSNGEKASPGPIETILRSCPEISDALVVGADRDQIGILLFPRASPPSKDLIDTAVPFLEQANRGSPSFAQVSRDMCLVIEDGRILPKSSKGTVQRGVAYDLFKTDIDNLYASGVIADSLVKRERHDIEFILREIITTTAPQDGGTHDLGTRTDLFNWGVNSLMAIKIRKSIGQRLNTGGHALSQNVVFEHPSIEQLSRHVWDLQENNEQTSTTDADSHVLMRELVEKHGTFGSNYGGSARPPVSVDRKKTYLLTGATGSLGIFLLQHLCQLLENRESRIICIVRAKNDQAARKRIAELAERRGLHVDNAGYEAYASDLTKNDLGLGSEVYQRLVKEVDVVIHAAWPVHFMSHLSSFEDSIRGTRNLINLVTEGGSHARMYFCSSLASVLNQQSNQILETISIDPSDAVPIGYAQSKWVVEAICAQAAQSGMYVRILRVGQLCGDTISGYWNEKEGWPLMIRTAQTTGCLPLLEETPSWLPVDLASRAIIDVLSSDQSRRDTVYHIAHPLGIEWHTLLDDLQTAGMQFQRISPSEWLKKVERSPEDDISRGILGLWREAYGSDSNTPKQKVVDVSNARNASETLQAIYPVGSEQIGRMVHAWRKTRFLR